MPESVTLNLTPAEAVTINTSTEEITLSLTEVVPVGSISLSDLSDTGALADAEVGDVPEWDGTEWVPGEGGGDAAGPAGGVLAGTYPNPSFAADMATQAELDAVAAAKANLTDPRFTDSRAPSGSAGGDLTGTYPNPTLAAVATPGSAGSSTSVPTVTIDAKGRITSLGSAAIPSAAAAATPALRAIGTGALEAAAGNDSRLSDSRAPNGSAGGDLTGTYPNPTIGTGKVTSTAILDGTILNADINAAAAIAGTKVDAGTDTVRGTLELATDAEAATGTSTSLAVTPANVASAYAAKALFVRKINDETVTGSSTVQDDDELFLAVAANSFYEVTAGLLVTSTANSCDFKYGFSGPVASRWTGGSVGYTAAATTVGGTATPGGALAAQADTAFAGIVTGVNNFIRVQLLLSVGVNAGTLRLQWAQNTNDGTSVTVVGQSNSWMSARKVA